MIAEHEDSYCQQGKHWTLGPRCEWCLNAPQTTRFSPAMEVQRAAAYQRFRAVGVMHADAIALLDQADTLARTDRAENARAVRDLVAEGREVFPAPAAATRPSVKPLFAPAPVAVAA